MDLHRSEKLSVRGVGVPQAKEQDQTRPGGGEALSTSISGTMGPEACLPPAPGEARVSPPALGIPLERRVFMVSVQRWKGERHTVLDNSLDQYALSRLNDLLREEWKWGVVDGGYGEFPDRWKSDFSSAFLGEMTRAVLNLREDLQGVHERQLPSGMKIYLVFEDARRHGDQAMMAVISRMDSPEKPEGRLGLPEASCAPGSGEVIARAMGAGFKAYDVENSAGGAMNLDHLGHRVAVLAHQVAQARYREAVEAAVNDDTRRRLQASAVEHGRLAEQHSHWALVVDPGTLARGGALLALLKKNSPSTSQTLGLPGWVEVDSSFMYEASLLQEAMAGDSRGWRGGLPSAVKRAEAFLAEKGVALPTGEEGWATLGSDQARSLEGRFAEQGLCAMYGGRKGHGFWISETTPEFARRIHGGDFSAEMEARAAGHFNPLGSDRNQERTGNSAFFSYDDAMSLLSMRMAGSLGVEVASDAMGKGLPGVSPLQERVFNAKGAAARGVALSSEAVNRAVAVQDPGVHESRLAHLKSQDAAELAGLVSNRTSAESAWEAQASAAEAHEAASRAVVDPAARDLHDLVSKRHRALEQEYLSLSLDYLRL